MANPKIKLLLFLFLLSFGAVYGQYTEVINSNRPGFSESPYSVGTGVYQIESNVFFRNTSIEPTFSRPQSLGLDLLFRTSFLLEKLELNANISYQKDKIAFKNIFQSHYFSTGLSNFTIGAKYLVFQQEYEDKTKEVRSWKRRMAFDKKRLIPSVAIYAGLNTDFVHELHQKGSMSAKAGILLQNNLSNDFNVITNVFYDYIGTDFSEISYIVTATYNYNDRWSSFFENQSIFKENETHSNLGLGLAYLYSRDLQINSSARFLLEGKSRGYYLGLGVSYRFDNHQDSYIDLDENANTPINRYNKKQNGFFKRLFSIFTKNNKKRGRSKNRKRN